MQFASDFDKERRAIKLGLHRERLITANRAIDNSTPRCYKEYQLNKKKNKEHQQKEKELEQKRRRRFSMMSPYSKHLKRSQSEHMIRRQSLNFELHSSNQIMLNALSLTGSLSPTNSQQSQLTQNTANSSVLDTTAISSLLENTANSSMLNSLASESQSRSMIESRGHNRRKRRGSKGSDSKSSTKRSAKLARKQKELEAENEKLRSRLSSVKSSNYLNSIQKHWSLHSNIRRNRRISNQKKKKKCPDIIYSDKYKQLQKQQTTEKEDKMRRFSGLRKTISLPVAVRRPSTVGTLETDSNDNDRNIRHSTTAGGSGVHRLPMLSRLRTH